MKAGICNYVQCQNEARNIYVLCGEILWGGKPVNKYCQRALTRREEERRQATSQCNHSATTVYNSVTAV
jgi:hypothetical protein